MKVLVLNAGSSSLRASVVDGRETLADAKLDWTDDHEADVRAALARLGDAGVDAVGYRVVHGGTRFTRATRIDDATLAALRELFPLAPLHLPLAERAIVAARRALPDVPHVAVFDTAFHRDLPRAAYLYPLPYEWHELWHVRRYGFHGLSVEWSVERAAEALGRPAAALGIVVAHLGSGCSVTAVWEGRSADTSMGMTPLEGVMMGTRAGSIDPGILLSLLRDGRLDLAALDDALERRSGLLGVSGTSADIRTVLAAADGGDERAALAVSLFIRRAAAGVAAVATALPRVDALVFTGGIGENATDVTNAIVDRLTSVGLAGIRVLRVEAREDVVIARHVRGALVPA